MRGYNITASTYNAATSNTPYAATANAKILIKHQYSNAYNTNTRSRDIIAANVRS